MVVSCDCVMIVFVPWLCLCHGCELCLCHDYVCAVILLFHGSACAVVLFVS